jgi:tetratricopeptide (TPR) repeat protein
MAKRSRKKRTPPSSSGSSSAPATQKFSGVGAFTATPWILLRALIIIALGWWVFLPVLHGGWIWDDNVYILQNPMMGDPARLWKIWTVPGSFIEYYPIEQTVQFAQWELFRFDTLGYHITNIVLHLLSALLVWRLLARLGLRLAWLGGLLFAIHPANVESVAWMSELKNTLSLPPFLLAACFYFDYDDHHRPRDYAWALGLFLVAMLCKVGMAFFPIIILLHAWWKRDRIGTGDFKAAAPFFLVSLILGTLIVLTGNWFRATHHMPPDHVRIATGLLARLDLIGLLIAWYFYQVVCPVSHSFFYPQWPIDPPTLSGLLPWFVLGGVVWFLWTKRHSWGRHALFGLGFFYINLAPFLGVTVASYMGFTWAMDHFLYLPIIGLIGLAVAALDRIDRQLPRAMRPGEAVLIAALVALLAFVSHRYARTFSDAITLWSHTIENDPGSKTAHQDLASAFLQDSRFADAIAQFNLAAKIDPRDADVWNSLGQALAQSGQLPQARTAFDTAIKVNSTDAAAYANRGHLLQIEGDPDGALADFDRALELEPTMPHPYINRSAIRLNRGDVSGAQLDLEIFCRLAPANPNIDYAHFWIWLIKTQRGQRVEADNELADALAHRGNLPPNEWTAQVGRYLLGQIDEKQFLAAAAATNPDQDKSQRSEAWYYIGMRHLIAGQPTDALICFQKCVEIGDPQALIYSLAQNQVKVLGAPKGGR